MMSDREVRRILRGNLRVRGSAVELIKLMEECGELVRAVARLIGGDGITDEAVDQLAEEMADVEILMEQARMIFPTLRAREDGWAEIKLMRLRAQLEDRTESYEPVRGA